MDIFSNLGLGIEVMLKPANILFCFIGAFLGTAVGVLPGVGPLATIAMLLPITFKVSPEASIIMLAGIYYGAQYADRWGSARPPAAGRSQRQRSAR